MEKTTSFFLLLSVLINSPNTSLIQAVPLFRFLTVRWPTYYYDIDGKAEPTNGLKHQSLLSSSTRPGVSCTPSGIITVNRLFDLRGGEILYPETRGIKNGGSLRRNGRNSTKKRGKRRTKTAKSNYVDEKSAERETLVGQNDRSYTNYDYGQTSIDPKNVLRRRSHVRSSMLVKRVSSRSGDVGMDDPIADGYVKSNVRIADESESEYNRRFHPANSVSNPANGKRRKRRIAENLSRLNSLDSTFSTRRLGEKSGKQSIHSSTVIADSKKVKKQNRHEKISTVSTHESNVAPVFFSSESNENISSKHNNNVDNPIFPSDVNPAKRKRKRMRRHTVRESEKSSKASASSSDRVLGRIDKLMRSDLSPSQALSVDSTFKISVEDGSRERAVVRTGNYTSSPFMGKSPDGETLPIKTLTGNTTVHSIDILASDNISSNTVKLARQKGGTSSSSGIISIDKTIEPHGEGDVPESIVSSFGGDDILQGSYAMKKDEVDTVSSLFDDNRGDGQNEVAETISKKPGVLSSLTDLTGTETSLTSDNERDVSDNTYISSSFISNLGDSDANLGFQSGTHKCALDGIKVSAQIAESGVSKTDSTTQMETLCVEPDVHQVDAQMESHAIILEPAPDTEVEDDSTALAECVAFSGEIDQVRKTRDEIKTVTNDNDDDSLVLSIVTWNLGESAPSEKDASFIRKFRKGGSSFDNLKNRSDLIMIGAQECEDIKPRRSEGHRSRHFRCLGIKMLGPKYVPLAIHSLGGIQMALFCHRDVLGDIEIVNIADVTCGVGNVFHNKGAIGVYLKLKHRSSSATGRSAVKSSRILLVTTHMAAHVKNVDARNEDFKRIIAELEAQAPARFLRPRKNSDGSLKPCDGSHLLNSMDHVFISGDLNYRVDLPREFVDSCIADIKKCTQKRSSDPDTSSRDVRREVDMLMNQLIRRDQLLQTVASGRAFSSFNEGKISFLPTFKFDKGSAEYDTSHKRRVPAWTDRILFKSRNIRVLEYTSVPRAMHSDHRPVYGTYQLGWGKVQPEAEKRRGPNSKRNKRSK